MRAEVAWLFATERYAVYITNWILYNYLVIKLGAAVVCNIHTDSERWRARGVGCRAKPLRGSRSFVKCLQQVSAVINTTERFIIPATNSVISVVDASQCGTKGDTNGHFSRAPVWISIRFDFPTQTEAFYRPPLILSIGVYIVICKFEHGLSSQTSNNCHVRDARSKSTQFYFVFSTFSSRLSINIADLNGKFGN